MDIQQMTLNESKIMKLTKSKLKEMVRDVLSEEDKLDLNKAYGVFLRGGSIGSGKYTMKKHNGDFVHDQNQRYLGRWTFVEEIPMKDRDKLASKYKKFNMYTYK